MVMIRCQQVCKVPVVLLFFLFSLMFEPTNSIPLTEHNMGDQYEPSSSERTLIQVQLTQNRDVLPETPKEEEDELFKDVDPKALAAVLLEALKKPQEEMNKNNRGVKDKEKKDSKTQSYDTERNGDQELELVRAVAEAHDREEREREEDEERKKEEEKEHLTEKVTSHTSSQTVPIQEKEVVEKELTSKETQQVTVVGTNGDKNEQLSPEELKNLETVLEEFQSYNTAMKRKSDSSSGQRGSRGDYFDYLDRNGLLNNEIKTKPKSYDMSKKKLKWQKEQEKNKNWPLYKEGNFMDEFNDNTEDKEEQNAENEKELLNSEEEEARAKAEQEEVRRQAAEAQRAKAEEEKLADIASDMILQYMDKQDGKKYRNNNAAEDKRSEEDSVNDDDEIDAQTIDKLIEISSKLHLPADDVVDIISDVEKKKKKDVPEILQWQRQLVSPPASDVPSTVIKTPDLSKPPKPNTNALKSWLKDRVPIKPSQQDFWIKQKWPLWPYSSYQHYQKPYSSYYTIYIPPPKPKPRYYAKPFYSINDILGNSLDAKFDYPPKQRYYPWTQTRPRAPLTFWENLYMPNYIYPPQNFKAIPIPKPRSPLRSRPAIYYSPKAAVVAPQNGFYSQVKQSHAQGNEELENFIERVFLKRHRMFQ